jgi:hypothetical protein
MAASTDRKSRTLIRFNSGATIYYKLGSAGWENLGEHESAKLVRKSATNEAVFARGDSLKKRGKREVSLQIVLSQNDQTVQERLDELMDGGALKVFIDNGLEGGKYQEYYFPEGEISDNFDMDMKGGSQQKLAIEISIFPQSANVSCTPDTDFPDEAHASGAVAVTGKNPFYKVIDTASA